MSQKASRRTIRNREQIQRALEYRRTGATYAEIGHGLAVSKTRAYQLVTAGLTELNADLKETAVALRELELLRLDGIAAAHWPNRANPRNAEILLKTSERRARLLGLDAPAKSVEPPPGRSGTHFGLGLVPADR